MTVVIPASVTAEGRAKVQWVPTIASLTAMTVVETGATGAVDLSFFLMPDWGGVTADQNKGEDRRFASKEGFDRLGTIKRTIADITYTYLPQTADTDAANKAYKYLTEGATGFLVVRLGIDADVAWTTGDKYVGWPAEAGGRTFNVTGADEFAPLTITQGLGATGVQFTGTAA